MITQVHTADIRDGKAMAAIEQGLKLANYLNENFGTNVQLMGNVAGPTYQLHWFVNFESLAAFEEMNAKVNADPGYHQLLAEAYEQELWFGNSVVDNLYTSLP
jgi:hypothetical protein